MTGKIKISLYDFSNGKGDNGIYTYFNLDLKQFRYIYERAKLSHLPAPYESSKIHCQSVETDGPFKGYCKPKNLSYPKHRKTDIDFSYPARSINLKQKCKITLGTRLSFSDIGECAFRLQNCIFTNGGTILLPQEASRKKSNKLSPEGIVKDYNSQCYMKFDKIMEQLKSYETIPVTDMQQSVWNILEKLKFSSAFGICKKITFLHLKKKAMH